MPETEGRGGDHQDRGLHFVTVAGQWSAIRLGPFKVYASKRRRLEIDLGWFIRWSK